MRLSFTFLMALYLIIGCESPSNHNDSGERHVDLEGEPNFRDLGGYETEDGKTVKWGLVYRSGKLSKLTDEDVATLDDLEISKVVNFLTTTEIEHAGVDQVPEQTEIVLCPIDTDDDLAVKILEARKTGDFSEVDASINPELHRMLVTEATDQYSLLFREILKQQGQPVVFHCSHGIHRTGTASAILLWSLGVPWETIRQDYLLSNVYRQEEIDKRVAQLEELGASNPDVTDPEKNTENIEAFYVLQGYYVDAVKETIEKEYGTIDNYLTQGLGLNTGEIAQLRAQLLQ